MRTRWYLAIVLSALLAACGGGDGDGATLSDSGGNPPLSGGGSGGSGGETGGGSGTGGGTGSDPGTPPSSGNGGGGDSGSGNGGGDTPAPGPLTDIRFNKPTGIAADGSGNLYVVDGEEAGNRIRRIAPDGSVATIVTVEGGYIHGITASPSGGIFFSSTRGAPYEGNPGHIWQFDDGMLIEIFATSGGAPSYMTVDPENGDLYFSDNGEIKRLSRDETVTTLFSANGSAAALAFHKGVLWVHFDYLGREGEIARWSEDGGLERVLRTNQSDGMVSTDDGIYIARYSYNRADAYRLSCTVDLFDPDTLQFTNVAGGGSAPCSYLDGTGQAARFDFMRSTLTQGSDGNLYVTDYNNDVIRRVTPAGVVTTYAGVASSPAN